MADSQPPLPLAYSDPPAYLAQRFLHRVLLFRPSFIGPDDPLHRVTYSDVGPPDGPLLFVINGLGNHRLFGAMLRGIASAHNVHIITLDRPSSGGSTPVPLLHRVQWAHEALLAIHAALSLPTSFSILSHSNGVIYTLYTLLHLPPHLTVLSWDLTSPWVSPGLSRSIPLSLARRVPAGATVRFGALLGGLSTILGPIVELGSWSSGVVKRGKPGREETPEKEHHRWEHANAALPVEERTFGGEYYSTRTQALGLEYVLTEGLAAMGIEALLSLRRGEGGEAWGWGKEEEEGGKRDEAGLYERGFGELKRSMEGSGKTTRMRVFYGTGDGMVPEKGRKYLRGVLMGKLGLVEEERWIEKKGAGHDVVIGLESVMGLVLGDVVARGATI